MKKIVIRFSGVVLTAGILIASGCEMIPDMTGPDDPVELGVWEENFDQAGEITEDWGAYAFDPELEGWSHVDGVLRSWISAADFYSLLFLFPDDSDVSTWTNYTVRVRARWIDYWGDRVDQAPQFGITLYDSLMGRGNPRYWASVKIDAGEIAIARPSAEEHDVEGDVREEVSRAFAAAQGEWIDLRASVMTVDGREVVEFQVNDMTPLRFETDEPYGSGALSLYIRGIEAEFDDFSVEGPNIPNHSP